MHEKREMADLVAILWLSMTAVMCTAPWVDNIPSPGLEIAHARGQSGLELSSLSRCRSQAPLH